MKKVSSYSHTELSKTQAFPVSIVRKYNEALPDNFNLSKIRLNNLKTRLDKNENLMIEYDKIIKQYINDDIVEPVRPTKTSYDP